MNVFFKFFFFLILCGCSSSYKGKDIYSADEFVIDSYKIKEGKYAILEMEGKEFNSLDPTLLDEYDDTIYEDDLLKISLFHPKRTDLTDIIGRLSSQIGFRVMGGKIYLPDLPPIQVANLTLKQASDLIRDTYRFQIEGIEVYLGYLDRTSRKVELAGLVGISSVPVDGKIRLFDVLSRAKIPNNANLFKSYLMRNDKMIPIDFYKLLKEGDMSQNIVMRGGDKIYIAESSSATMMVMGEVRYERVIDLPSGFLSLREALAMSGGIPFSGDKSFIQIIRGNIARPKIYVVSWEHVIHLPNDSLLLMPGDIVYVASKPITEWNRFISQLLPSFTGLEIAKRGMNSVGVCVP